MYACTCVCVYESIIQGFNVGMVVCVRIFGFPSLFQDSPGATVDGARDAPWVTKECVWVLWAFATAGRNETRPRDSFGYPPPPK